MTIAFGVCLWLLLGVIGSLYWPWKYRDVMTAKDWQIVISDLPLTALFGPLAFLACFPV